MSDLYESAEVLRLALDGLNGPVGWIAEALRTLIYLEAQRFRNSLPVGTDDWRHADRIVLEWRPLRYRASLYENADNPESMAQEAAPSEEGV